MEASSPLTTFLAVWGALCSSIAIGWNLYRDLSDRGKLRVSCYIGKLVTQGGPDDPNDYLVWNVTNTGRQSIMVQHIGGKGREMHFLILPHGQLPRMLAPGEYLVEYTDDLSCLDEDLRDLTAIDTTGKYYRVPRKQVRKLKRDYRERSVATTKTH